MADWKDKDVKPHPDAEWMGYGVGEGWYPTNSASMQQWLVDRDAVGVQSIRDTIAAQFVSEHTKPSEAEIAQARASASVEDADRISRRVAPEGTPGNWTWDQKLCEWLPPKVWVEDVVKGRETVQSGFDGGGVELTEHEACALQAAAAGGVPLGESLAEYQDRKARQRAEFAAGRGVQTVRDHDPLRAPGFVRVEHVRTGEAGYVHASSVTGYTETNGTVHVSRAGVGIAVIAGSLVEFVTRLRQALQETSK